LEKEIFALKQTNDQLSNIVVALTNKITNPTGQAKSRGRKKIAQENKKADDEENKSSNEYLERKIENMLMNAMINQEKELKNKEMRPLEKNQAEIQDSKKDQTRKGKSKAKKTYIKIKFYSQIFQ